MAGVHRDPAELLSRIPELKSLVERHAGLARAVERGRPHELYYRLQWLRWFGKNAEERRSAGVLLANRRLFAVPIRKAPPLVTINGVGTTVYGTGEPDSRDATYITTHFLVLVFVPIYPFSAYWVRQAPSGKGWNFIAKVPLSPLVFVWQRGLALALLAVALVVGWHSFENSRHQVLHVVNPLPIPITASIDGSTLAVPARERGTVRLALGKHSLEIRGNRRVLEKSTLDIDRRVDVFVWNVLGLGVVYEEQAEYRAQGRNGGGELKPRVHCGENKIAIDDVDYPFLVPPNSMKLSSKEELVRKSVVGFAEKGSCTSYYFGNHEPARAAETMARYAEALGFADDETTAALDLTMNVLGAAAAEELAERAIAAQPRSIPIHRIYQDLARQSRGREAVLARYRSAYQAAPDSAEAGYLYARLLDGEEERRVLAELRAKFPSEPYLLRMAAYTSERNGQNEQAAAELQKLHVLAPILAEEAIELEVAVLAALGRIDSARRVVIGALKSQTAHQPSPATVAALGLLLSKREPTQDPEAVIAELHADDADLLKYWKLRARVEGLASVNKEELAGIDAKVRPALAIQLALRDNPAAALSEVASTSRDALGALPMPAWILLVAEAERYTANAAALTELLAAKSALGRVRDAILAYLKDGTEDPELTQLDLASRAALHLARARMLPEKAKDREPLQKLARREDPLRGLVTLGLETWH